MVTVLEQLKVEYEASTPGEWLQSPETDIYTEAWTVADFVPKEDDRKHICGAHNRMPPLLVVAEAAVGLVNNEPIIEDQAGWYCSICGASSTESGFGIVHGPDCEWLLARAAVAPLLEEAAE